MCDLFSGYRYPDGSLHFHDDADVEAEWERRYGGDVAISWHNMVGHAGYAFVRGQPPAGAVEVEGLQYALDLDLRKFRNLMRAGGYKSIAVRDAASVEKGRKLYAEGYRLCAEGRKLIAEGSKLIAEGRKLIAEGRKPIAEGRKPTAEGQKLYAKGDKLYAEGRKLYAKGRKLYAKGDKLCFVVVPSES